MAAPRLSYPPEVFSAAYAVSTNALDLCTRLGCHYHKHSIVRLCTENGLPYPAPHWVKERPVDLTPPTSTPEEAVAEDRALLRLRAENQELRRKYTEACKTGNLYEDLLDTCRSVMGKVTPASIHPPHIGSGHTHEDAILGWADWHGGEVVDPVVMLGYNAYDPQIMCRRAQYTVDHSLSILYDTMVGTTIDKLFVFDLGDGINGDLRLEQLATNALPVFEAIRLVACLKARCLTELSTHLPVVYLSVPGNHGRRNPKMNWKQPSETADWLISQMVADMTAANERITVIAPKAWTAVIQVRNSWHSVNHGFSAAKGGYGGIPWYSYKRSDAAKTAIEAAHNIHIDCRWYGHIHQKAEIPMADGQGEQFVIGSLKGGDEHALEELAAYADPVQKLVLCHDEYGVTGRWPLDVKHADEQPSRYEDLL